MDGRKNGFKLEIIFVLVKSIDMVYGGWSLGIYCYNRRNKIDVLLLVSFYIFFLFSFCFIL